MTTAILTVVIGLLAGCDGDPKTLGPGYLPVSESSCLDLDSSEVLAEVKGRMGDSDYLDDLLGGVVLAQFHGIAYFSNRRIDDLVAVFQTKAASFALVRLDR
ncbi:MAG: hypothetical protein KDA28_09030 [Phycisphaerales bacterium]|nr:hypothetical protein [Phycisphaerales bacterium]